ncbi:unnamed protein product [Ranitomeya imitator]|uniref:Uncharacterized protein n=1 Tax=Ranitomeya imitator TaxID=111125 RepID=A0ABN9L994_9NEOB|nr:unnamed protein product [Ranitomeya imitator]
MYGMLKDSMYEMLEDKNLAGYEESLPMSEKSNPITRELDKADANTLVQLLRDCDAEIFQEEDETIINYQVGNGKEEPRV